MDIMVLNSGNWIYLASTDDIRSAKMVATAIANFYKTACQVHRSGATLYIVGATE